MVHIGRDHYMFLDALVLIKDAPLDVTGGVHDAVSEAEAHRLVRAGAPQRVLLEPRHLHQGRGGPLMTVFYLSIYIYRYIDRSIDT